MTSAYLEMYCPCQRPIPPHPMTARPGLELARVVAAVVAGAAFVGCVIELNADAVATAAALRKTSRRETAMCVPQAMVPVVNYRRAMRPLGRPIYSPPMKHVLILVVGIFILNISSFAALGAAPSATTPSASTTMPRSEWGAPLVEVHRSD